MDTRQVMINIDSSHCTGCGLCLSVCPSETLSLIDGKAVVTGDRSLSCGHCQAICPENAIMVQAIDPDVTTFKTFNLNQDWVPHGKFSPSELAGLMASRRSCRNYKEDPIPWELLEDLIKLGTLAPSGTNSQLWRFTVCPDRTRVLSLAYSIRNFFKKLNRTAEKKWLRTVLFWIGKPELSDYYHDYYETVEKAIHDAEEKGIDNLFHGAPALIIVSVSYLASCPGEDAMLAAGNILLGAHALGLGTCLVGFAVNAMNRDSRIKQDLEIPSDETIHAVIALGYPNERYLRITGRKPVVIRGLKR